MYVSRMCWVMCREISREWGGGGSFRSGVQEGRAESGEEGEERASKQKEEEAQTPVRL